MQINCQMTKNTYVVKPLHMEMYISITISLLASWLQLLMVKSPFSKWSFILLAIGTQCKMTYIFLSL